MVNDPLMRPAAGAPVQLLFFGRRASLAQQGSSSGQNGRKGDPPSLYPLKSLSRGQTNQSSAECLSRCSQLQQIRPHPTTTRDPLKFRLSRPAPSGAAPGC